MLKVVKVMGAGYDDKDLNHYQCFLLPYLS